MNHIFKKKTIIDLDHLENYPNIFCINVDDDNAITESRFKEFLKKFNIEVEDEERPDYMVHNLIYVSVNLDKCFGIFNSTIDEIEFKDYKKSTKKPMNYAKINKTEKFEIIITGSKGATIYYFVKEKTK